MIQKRDFAMFLVLTFVTCGIYSLFFFYSLTEDLNKICAGDGQETTNFIVALLLGFVTCSIYLYYWYYTVGNRMYENGPRYNVNIQENGSTIVLWLILGSFIVVGPFIGYFFIIKNFNLLADAYNSGATQA